MEKIVYSLPAAVSAVLAIVLVLMVITNIITEVLKKNCPKLPPNIVATVVAMLLTMVALLAVCQIKAVAITWYMVAAAIVLGFFVAFAAMFGFDKFKQTLEQITRLGKS